MSSADARFNTPPQKPSRDPEFTRTSSPEGVSRPSFGKDSDLLHCTLEVQFEALKKVTIGLEAKRKEDTETIAKQAAVIEKQAATIEKQSDGADSWQAVVSGSVSEDELQQLRQSFGADPLKLGARGELDPKSRTGLKVRQLMRKVLNNSIACASQHYGLSEAELWEMHTSYDDFQVMLEGFKKETASLKEDSKMKPLLTAIGNAYRMAKFGSEYKQLLRQLISLLADPVSKLTRGEVHKMITDSGVPIAFNQVKAARKHALDEGAGMPVPKGIYGRICSSQTTMRAMAKWRFSDCVVELNKGSSGRSTGAGRIARPPCKTNRRPARQRNLQAASFNAILSLSVP
jgi:hypothetical protein